MPKGAQGQSNNQEQEGFSGNNSGCTEFSAGERSQNIKWHSLQLHFRFEMEFPSGGLVGRRQVDHAMPYTGRIRCRTSRVETRRIALARDRIGLGPSWQRQAYPGRHEGASHVTTVSRCGRARARFWRFGKTPRRLSAPPGFPMSVSAGHRAGKRRDRRRRPCGDSAGHASRFRRCPDRPIRHRPGHTVPPLLPSPADRRRYASSDKSPAVPATAAACPMNRPAVGAHPTEQNIRLGGEPGAVRRMRMGQTHRIVRPRLRRIQLPVDEGVAMAGTQKAKTSIRQSGTLPADPVYCRVTPHDILPCRGNRSRPDPASRLHRPASRGLLASVSRSASASRCLRPGMACCHHGPGSPAAPTHIQPVLRRSTPRGPSGNRSAGTATHLCVNRGGGPRPVPGSEDARSPVLSQSVQPSWIVPQTTIQCQGTYRNDIQETQL